MKRLRILHVITRLERGGSSDCTLWQAIGAARRGHQVVLVSGPTDRPSPLEALARRTPRLRRLSMTPLVRRPAPRRDLRALGALVAVMRRGRFDVVHLHTSKAGALGRLAALLTGHTRRVVHQPHGHLFYGYYGALGSALVLAVERALAPLSRLVLTLTDAGAGEHLARGIGRPEQYRTLPSGIDFRALRAGARRRSDRRRALGFGADEFVVATLCRLEAIKGAEVLARAFVLAAAGRPGLRLLIAGDGPLLPRLRALLAEAGLASRAQLGGGWAPPEEILPAADVVVLASLNEGMGRVLVEAMAIGRPVVATAVGGVPELLLGGEAGILVPPGDAPALAAAIGRLADDPALVAALARRGRSRAGAFGAGRMVHRLLDLYGEVAA